MKPTTVLGVVVSWAAICSLAQAQTYTESPQDIIRKVDPGESRQPTEAPRQYESTGTNRSDNRRETWSGAGDPQSGMYLRVGGMLQRYGDVDFAIFDVTFETGTGFALAAGYDFGPVTDVTPGSDEFSLGIRAELELAYQTGDIDKIAGVSVDGEVESTSILVNGFLDFDFSGPVTLFVGLGLGSGKIRADIPGFLVDEDTVLTAQVQIGLEFEISDQVSFYTALKSQAYDDIEMTGIFVENFNNASIEAGLRFTF